MKTLVLLIEAEFLKHKGTRLLLTVFSMSLVCAFLMHMTILHSVVNLTKQTQAVESVLVQQAFLGLFTFIFPVSLPILIQMVYQVDHQNGMWRHFFVLPLTKPSVFVSKTIFTLAISGLYISLFAMFMGGSLTFISINKQVQLSYAVLINQLTVLAFKGWLASWPMALLHNWISYRVKMFAVPIIIGIAGAIICATSLQSWSSIIYFPYALPAVWLTFNQGYQSLTICLCLSVFIGLASFFDARQNTRHLL